MEQFIQVDCRVWRLRRESTRLNSNPRNTPYSHRGLAWLGRTDAFSDEEYQPTATLVRQ